MTYRRTPQPLWGKLLGDMLWAGLDAGERETSLCVIDENGKPVLEASLPSTVAAIDKALALVKTRLTRVGIEGGVGSHLVRHLRMLGYDVVVFEAKKVHRFLTIRRNKTDENDAQGIAEVTRFGIGVVSQVHIKNQAFQHLQSQLVMREMLIRQKVTVVGALQGLLALYGGRRVSTQSPTRLRESVVGQIAGIEGVEGIAIRDDVENLLDLSETIRAQVIRLDRKLEKFALQNQVCRRLMTVPGVGPNTALTFYSLIQDPSRFRRNEEVGAYLGLVPLVRQSGNSLRKGRISKMGNKRARTLLVTAATCLLRKGTAPSKLKEWGIELAGRAGVRKARVALARKLAIVMLTMWDRECDFIPYPSNRRSADEIADAA